MSNPKTLVLVDGSSYLYRAYHALPDLYAVPGDPSSYPTGAIRGMINMMEALRKAHPADYAACIFDAPGPTFRDAIYPDYKANRSPMQDRLRQQIAPIYEVVRALGWPVLAVPGVEADDVIGTLAHTAAQQGVQVIVSSGDKDLSQLVNEQVTIIDTMNGKRRDVAGVTAEFGVAPALMVDFQTLVGDSTDNVPGVPKVGEKTAAKWLNQYGSLAAVVAHAHEIKGVVGQSLRDHLGLLAMGRELVTIKTDCDLSAWLPDLPALQALAMGQAQTATLYDFYQHYGFKAMARALAPAAAPPVPKALQAPAAPAPPAAPARGESGDLFAAPTATELAQAIEHRTLVYETLLDWAALERWLLKIQTAALVAIDTETTSLNAMRAELVGISLSVQPGEAAYIPLGHTGPDTPEQLPLDAVLERLRPWLEDASRAKLGQHIKYDRHILANYGIEVRGYAHDTMLQSYVLEVHKPHSLTSLAERHLGRSGISYEDLCGKGVHQISFAQVPVDKAAAYACEDADQTLDVHQALWPLLAAHDKLRAIYALEIASSEVLYQVERHGVLIDAPLLAAQSQQLGLRIHELEQEAYKMAGQPFNLNSPKQLGEIFFDQLKLDVVKKTASGARSTNEEVLEELAKEHPLPATILEHRGLSKLKNTYTDKLAGMAHPRTGRVHTHYAQAVAVTGRLSSNEPNLQNIPIRTPEGRRVREAFIAAPGKVIASADYSQIELRIMAHLSGDHALLHAFQHGLDVHRATAAEVFGVTVHQVTQEQRRYAKVINFGLIYGMSSFGLARNLGIEPKAAKDYIQRYFERYPGVKQYMDDTKAQAKAMGYVETVFGRRLMLPEINSPNGPRRAGAERAAINAPMQGTAADLIKMAMVAVQKALEAKKPQILMIMQVHDELVFELPEGEVDWLRQHIPCLMADVANLRVPLLAEVGVGPNWEQAH